MPDINIQLLRQFSFQALFVDMGWDYPGQGEPYQVELDGQLHALARGRAQARRPNPARLAGPRGPHPALRHSPEDRTQDHCPGTRTPHRLHRCGAQHANLAMGFPCARATQSIPRGALACRRIHRIAAPETVRHHLHAGRGGNSLGAGHCGAAASRLRPRQGHQEVLRGVRETAQVLSPSSSRGSRTLEKTCAGIPPYSSTASCSSGSCRKSVFWMTRRITCNSA
jgi:hypothetical protein